MRGALGLIAIAAVAWVFWMSYQWLRNPDNRKGGERKQQPTNKATDNGTREQQQ